MPHPFGIEFGSTPNSNVASYNMSIENPPKRHPDFAHYTGLWTPEERLKMVIASSKIFEGDDYGSASIALYEKVKRQLVSVYGECEDLEYIEEHSIWNGSHEFARSIEDESRKHCCFWREDRGARLDSEISQITLRVSSCSYEDLQIVLSYVMITEADSQISEAGLEAL